MLENIHIQNFRCFEDFKAEGFERINLIGGKNNSGKTCLLEALLLIRKLETSSRLEFVQKVASLRNEEIKDLFNQNFTEGTNFKDITVSVIANKGTTSQYSFSTDVLKDINGCFIDYKNPKITYISYKKSLPDLACDQLYAEIEKKDKEEIYIEFLSKIDKSIKKIKKIQFDKNTIQLKQIHNVSFVKLSSFGDAISNVYRYSIPLIRRKIFEEDFKETYILLIDETENGIHYTAHQDFWQKMFVLAKELNVQIFATTHSLEMIQAFNKVAVAFEKENPDDKGAYFEMSRNIKTNTIFAEKHDSEQLEYEMASINNFEKTYSKPTFRGE